MYFTFSFNSDIWVSLEASVDSKVSLSSFSFDSKAEH